LGPAKKRRIKRALIAVACLAPLVVAVDYMLDTFVPRRLPGSATGDSLDRGLLDLRRWRTMADESEWRKELSRIRPFEETDIIRQFTNRGRPLGNAAFVARIEHAIGRRVHALPEGRPPEAKRNHN